MLSHVSAPTGGRLCIALSGGATVRRRETQEFLTTALVIMVRYTSQIY